MVRGDRGSMLKNSRLRQENSKEVSESSRTPLVNTVKLNVEQVKEKLGSSADLINRFIQHNDNKYAFAVIHIDGISSTKIILEHILEPLLTYKSVLDAGSLQDELEQTIAISNIKVNTTLEEVLS